MPTRAEAARANGAKSRGPATAEGKQKSSRNSLNHGFTAHNTILLEYENPEEFQEMLAEYRETYQPTTAAQRDLVDQMVAARWRIRRLWTIETALLDAEISRRHREHLDPNSAIELAQAFRTLADDSRSLHLISRYESRLQRMHAQAHAALRELQNKNCETNPSPPPEPETQPNLDTTPNSPFNPQQDPNSPTRGAGMFPAARFPIGLPLPTGKPPQEEPPNTRTP